MGPPQGAWFSPSHWSGGIVPNSPAADVWVDQNPDLDSSVTIDGDLQLNTLTVTPGDAVRLDEGWWMRANAVNLDGGSFVMESQSILRDAVITGSGGGGLRVARSSTVGVQNVTLRTAVEVGEVGYGGQLTLLSGTTVNEAIVPGVDRINLDSDTGSGGAAILSAQGDNVMLAAGPGRIGEVRMTQPSTLAATFGSLTLANQFVHGSGHVLGTFFNGSAEGPSRLVADGGGAPNEVPTMYLGFIGWPTTVTQTDDSSIEAIGGHHRVWMTGSLTVNGGRLLTADQGEIEVSGSVTFNKVRSAARIFNFGPDARLILNDVVHTGTIMMEGGSRLVTNNTDLSHSHLEFRGPPSVLELDRPLELRSGASLWIDQSTFTVDPGTDLAASDGARIVVRRGSTLTGAASRTIRVAGGAAAVAVEGSTIFTDGGDFVVGPGGLAGVSGGTLGAPAGHLDVEAGTVGGKGLLVNARLRGGSSVLPGDDLHYDWSASQVHFTPAIGSLTVAGVLDLDDSAHVSVDLLAAGGNGAATSGVADRLVVAGTAHLAGALSVRLLGQPPVLPGESFDVLSFASRTGAFDVIENQSGFAGLSFVPSYSSGALTLSVGARGGDADLDGIVNLADFNILAAHFGGADANWLMADFTGDGLVNLADFNVLAGNFGQAARGEGPTPADWSALAAVVPEPGPGLWLTLVVGSLPLQRRCRGR